MAESSSKYRDRVFSYSLYCNGTKVNDKYSMTFVNIRLGVNKIGKATLKFNAGDMDAQTFEETDSNSFKPGTSIRLDAGDVHSEKTIFEGIVIQLKIEIEEGTRAQMVVECRDCAYPATLGRKNRVFEDKKDSDIIADVLRGYGSVTTDATTYKHSTLVQYYCTDWDFALARAEANGLFITVREKNIQVKKPNVQGSPVLTVTYGNDLIDFDGGISVTDQFEAVEGISWDPVQQKVVTSTANVPTLNKQGDLSSHDLKEAEKQLWQTDAPIGTDALQNWTNGIALKNGLSRYEGSFMFYGCAEVIPGCIVELAGMGKRFNGMVYVGQVEHEVKDNIWTTRAYMGVSASRITDEPDVVAPAASGWLPGVEGLHIGKVKKLEGDPLKENRIQIVLPWLNGEKKEFWARLTTVYASNHFGFSFLPEVEDEVVIGFFNNDPCHPVVLGSMYSSKLSPAYPLEAKNELKAIVTREKMKIEFDEKKKMISISTPGKNKIEISDDGKSITLSDQHKNELILNQDGITLNSAKDILLKAKNNIVLDAVKTSLKAKSDVEIEGMNVKATAKVSFTAKGNATAEVSASGQTTIKGGIVMIN